MNWNDPEIDWQSPHIIDLWEYRDGNECVGCGRPKGSSHLEYCDIERCASCGKQMICCMCEATEICIPEDKFKGSNDE